MLKMVVGEAEGKRRRITVVLGCGRGREGGFGDERLQYGKSGEVGGGSHKVAFLGPGAVI